MLRDRLCVIALAFLACGQAFAQVWPTRPITLVVPYAAGGGTDVTARLLGKRLGETFGQPVIVENKPGANGAVGTSYVARAAADGYTLLLANPGPNAIGPLLTPNVGYDPEKDFAPVAVIAYVPLLVCVNASSSIKNISELVTAGKASSALNFGSAGNGSPSHLATAMFNNSTGTQFLSVPYKGSAPVAMALLSSEIQVAMLAGPDAVSHIAAGKLRAIANMSTRRAPAFPDVPLLSEAGVQGFDANIWYGILAPAKTPPEIVTKLHKQIAAIMEEPAIKARFDELAITPASDSPTQFAATIRADLTRYSHIIKIANVKAE